MKNYFLLLLFVCGIANSQIDFGIKGGLNIADIYYNIENYNPGKKAGYHFEGVARYDFCEGFGIQSELGYSQEGHEFETLGKLNWPLFFRANLGQFGLYGGDQLSFLINADMGKEFYEKSNFGGIAGIDYKLKSGLFFDLRYNFGTESINRDFVEVSTDNGAIYQGYVAYPRVLQVSLGYMF